MQDLFYKVILRIGSMEGGNEKVGDIKRILMEALKKKVKIFYIRRGGSRPVFGTLFKNMVQMYPKNGGIKPNVKNETHFL